MSSKKREFRTSVVSRERNRMHARKTRQRKKEHMANLQNRANELKEQQLKLRQAVNEKNTASILVGLFAKEDDKQDKVEDPRVEELLTRSADDIPDASKVSELPALILPGHHASKKAASSAATATSSADPKKPQHVLPDDGIDYNLLSKDRSKCTPEELDRIRRERNRMHAKRTRDRKRVFMEEMEEIIKKISSENELLQEHLVSLGGERLLFPTATLVSPRLVPSNTKKPEMADLLLVAGAFENRDECDAMNAIATVATALSDATCVSGDSSACEPEEAPCIKSSDRPLKKQRTQSQHEAPASVIPSLPASITIA